jgi:hypothetical protein
MQPLSKRAIASRANGAKSQGPTSSAGKRRSSANSLRHGLLAKCIVLKNESTNVFSQFFDEYVQKFNPADGVEYAAVEEMVAAAWRIRRIWDAQTAMIDKGIDRSNEPTHATRTADAFTGLATGSQIQLLDRYETRLQRIYQRALNNLLILRQIPEEDPYPEPNEPILCPSDTPLKMPNEPTATAVDQEVEQEVVAEPLPTVDPEAIPNEPKPFNHNETNHPQPPNIIAFPSIR